MSIRRIFCTAFGKPARVVAVREVELPAPRAGEVLIEIAAAPINPADLLLLEGRHLFKPELPSPVGIEGAGVVVAVGPGVETLVPGRKVALPFGGTWSEQVIMRAADVVALPDDIDLVQASMLSVNPMTAAGLIAGMQAGEWLIQNAANSAVGKLVIRLARRRGVKTINIVRRPVLADELRALGADAVIVGEEELPSRVAEVTAGAPVRRALDAIAGESAGKLFACVSEGGSLVCYGLLSGDSVVLPAAQLVFRDVTVTGYSRLRNLRKLSEAQVRAMYAELAEMLIAGEITSEIEASYPFARVAEAVAHATRDGRRGKIVLLPR